MRLKEYFKAKRGNAKSLTEKLGVSKSYLSQMAVVGVSPKRAVEIEFATDGAVTRRDLFPDDWRLIWPELK